MSDTTRLSERELARFRRKLEAMREAILAAELSSLHGQQDNDREPGDSADEAERAIEQDRALHPPTFDPTVLAEIDHALQKLDDGTFGLSEESGAPIDLERLDAIPWARHTAEEEERHERVDRAAVRHPTL